MWKQNRRRIPSLITGLVLIVALLAGAGLVASSLLGTPFTTSTVDHSPPTVIVDLRDLAEYHAAQGQFEVVIDHDQSHVMNRDRGLFNRIGGVFSDNPTSEADLYEAASDKMAAAAETTDLLQRAEDNVTSMLNTLLRSLGFERVDIRFPAG